MSVLPLGDPNAFRSRTPNMTAGERLLVGAVIVWAAARRGRQTPNRAVADVLAQRAGPRVAALFVAWIQSVEAACLRPMETECPGCGGVGLDLQRLVVACGVAPVDMDVGEQLLAPLVSDPAGVMTLARGLNAAMAQAGWPLPARLHSPAEPCGAPAATHDQTFH